MINQTKTLPINMDTKIKIECWTYYKMMIIETMENYMNWLSSHMDLFYGDVTEGLYYGNMPKMNQPEYYSDILNIEEIDLYDISPDNIINEIKQSIDDNYYFVVYVRPNDLNTHEALIYGYDDGEKCFYSFSGKAKKDSKIRNVTFECRKLPYDEFVFGYKNELDYFKNNSKDYYIRRDIGYGYVMSRIKPNDKYSNKNYAAEYFDKIEKEANGGCSKVEIRDENRNLLTSKIYYTGIDCLLKIADKSRKFIAKEVGCFGHTYEQGLKRNIFKLSEHRNLIYDSMKWYEQFWNVNDNNIIALQNKYKALCDEMQITSLLFLKYQQTEDMDIMRRIVDRLEEQYKKEKPILMEYSIRIRDWYMCNKLKMQLSGC